MIPNQFCEIETTCMGECVQPRLHRVNFGFPLCNVDKILRKVAKILLAASHGPHASLQQSLPPTTHRCNLEPHCTRLLDKYVAASAES